MSNFWAQNREQLIYNDNDLVILSQNSNTICVNRKGKTKDSSLFTGLDSLYLSKNSLFNEIEIEDDSEFNFDSILTFWYFLNGELYFVNACFPNEQTFFEFYETGLKWNIWDTSFVWFPNGKLSQLIYKIDSLSLLTFGTWWYSNGNMKKEVTLLNDGLVLSKKWHKNGQSKSETILNKVGYIVGREKLWYENGQLEIDVNLEHGKQPYVAFYSNGNKSREGTIINNSLYWVDERTDYWPNGNYRQISYFNDGRNYTQSNFRINTWKYYNEKGELIKEEIYKEGELQETKEYLPLNVKKE